MDNLHDLATTIGNSAAFSVLCAMGAGLAALSLMAGVARFKRDNLPADYPSDAEALQSKYILAFQQLSEARKENPNGLKNLIAGLRGQSAPALCLTAFDEYSQAQVEDQSAAASSIDAAKSSTAAKKETPDTSNKSGKKSARNFADDNPSRLKKPPSIKGPGGNDNK